MPDKHITDARTFYEERVAPNNPDKTFIIPDWAVLFAERYADCRMEQRFKALHPSESAAVNVVGWVTYRMPSIPGDYYCKCKIDGEPKRLVIELDKNLQWGEAPFDRYDDFEILAWLNESPAAAQSGKEEAIDIMLWAFVNIEAWDKRANLVTLIDGSRCDPAKLYDIFKQQNK